WAYVVSRICGQPHGCRRTNQLDVDVEVVLFLTVPGKGHLIAVWGKAWRPLRTRITSERDHFGRGQLSGTPTKEPHGTGNEHENEYCSHPKPGLPSWPNHWLGLVERSRVGLFLQFLKINLHISHVLIAPLPVFPQAAVDDLFQIARN